MKNKITPQQNQSNMQNANKRTNGVNKQYAQNQGNRGGKWSTFLTVCKYSFFN